MVHLQYMLFGGCVLCIISAVHLIPVLRAGINEYYNFRYKQHRSYKDFIGEVQFSFALAALGAVMIVIPGVAWVVIHFTGKLQ